MGLEKFGVLDLHSVRNIHSWAERCVGEAVDICPGGGVCKTCLEIVFMNDP